MDIGPECQGRWRDIVRKGDVLFALFSPEFGAASFDFLRAMQTGTGLSLEAADGMFLHPGTQAVSITDLSQVWLIVNVFARDISRLSKDMPGVTNVWIRPIKNRIDMLATGIKTPVGVKISGADLTVIEQIGIAVEATARYMMSVSDVQDVVQTAIGGMQVSESVEGLDRFPINLRDPQSWRDSPERLENLAGRHALGCSCAARSTG